MTPDEVEFVKTLREGADYLSIRGQHRQAIAVRVCAARMARTDEDEFCVLETQKPEIAQAPERLTEGEAPRAVCPRCLVDRLKSPCPSISSNCPMRGEARGAG